MWHLLSLLGRHLLCLLLTEVSSCSRVTLTQEAYAKSVVDTNCPSLALGCQPPQTIPIDSCQGNIQKISPIIGRKAVQPVVDGSHCTWAHKYTTDKFNLSKKRNVHNWLGIKTRQKKQFTE